MVASYQKKSFQKKHSSKISKLKITSSCALITASLCFTTVPTFAQSNEEASSSTIALDTITVTARQFEEPLKEVPFGISLLTGDQIEKLGIKETADFYRSVPNFNYTDSGLPEANLLNIRGIGSSSTFLSPSVTYYIDGVPISQRAFDQQFLDVARIEVLKGPQGTLFGQNSQAGAINILTNEAMDEKFLEIGGEYGNYDAYKLNIATGGKITDKMYGRINGQIYSRDGDIRNVLFSNPTTISSDEEVIRDKWLGAVNGKLRFDLTKDTTAILSGRLQRDKRNPTTGLLLDNLSDPKNSLNPIPENKINSGLASLKVEHKLDNATLTSITGFHAYNLSLKADITDGFLANASSGFPVSVFGANNSLRQINEDLSQWSQELRLDGTTSNGIRWVTGVSGLYSDFNSTTDVTISPSPILANGAYHSQIDKLNLAAFGEVTIPLAERFRYIAGLRLTHEENDYDALFLGRKGGAPAVDQFKDNGKIKDTFLTGRTGISYDLSENITTFATISRGAKAGGFAFFNDAAAKAIANTPFEKSSTWTYEVGLKGNLTQNAFLNASLFFNDTKDEQLFIFNPLAGQFTVENADTESYGAELELTLTPIEGLTLSSHLGLLKTELVSTSNSARIQKGNEVPYAPKVTAGVTANYIVSASSLGLTGDISFLADYQFIGSREFDPANTARLEDYHLVNLRIGYKQDNFEIYTFAKNLFEETYVDSAFVAGTTPTNSPVIGGVPGQPRLWGVGAKVRF